MRAIWAALVLVALVLAATAARAVSPGEIALAQTSPSPPSGERAWVGGRESHSPIHHVARAAHAARNPARPIRAERPPHPTLSPEGGEGTLWHWVGSWSAAQQLPEPSNQLPEPFAHDATIRQTVHLSLGGQTIRVRISNAYGTTPLHLTAVHVARPSAPGIIVPQSDTPLTFAGRADVTVPPGADYLSDPLAFPVAPYADLTISLHAEAFASPPTGHPGARATSLLATGDQVSAAQLASPAMLEHWYMIADVAVQAPSVTGAVVALGDSITDGRGSIPDANNRWPDDLARRLPGLGVLNKGIGGNRLLLDGLGPNALARFDRDVLAEDGVRWLIVLEGINDLGTLTRDAPVSAEDHAALVVRMTIAWRQIIDRAHAHGLKVMVGTLTPWMGFDYYHPDAENEADRKAVNAWLRTQANADALVDFDRVLRDPAAPDRLAPAYDSGDHLHPSPAGYQAMADAIPLAFFTPPHKSGRK
jgi:lysophospholipase L1-like esterase